MDKDRNDTPMSSPQMLSNRYEIGDTLGFGGMSEVHRGRDIRLGRDVAVKVLRADLARDPTFQLRFRREAQNAAALNHPAIVAVYDTGETDSSSMPLPYIVMEYVDGRTLRDIVKSEGPLSARRAMEVMADACAALDFSHRHGIVHRDVKPANIMITKSGAVKVMDFGIARAVADGQAAVTQTAAVIGTAQYLSPEQARGESVDARSDVYAAGCVLFELLTGEPPFTGDSPVAVAYQHVREEPRKPSDVNKQVPASLDAVVLKALSKNPVNRYQSAAEMRADLVRVLSGQRPKAPMIMTEEERTSLMAGAPAATEMMRTRRHRATNLVEPEDDYAYVDQGQRHRRWWIALVAVICVAVVALIAWLATSLLFNNSANARIQVNSYVGLQKLAAGTQARGDGWAVVNYSECQSTRDKIDSVISQTPAPGQTVSAANRGPLQLCIGSGPAQVQVPNLYGKTPQQAQQLLAQAKLSLGTSQPIEVSDPSLVGKIVQWDHQSGTVDVNSAINVSVGQKVQLVTVPPVTSLPFNQAQSILTSLGLQVTKKVTSSDQPQDTVVTQDPAPNTQVRPNSTVTLTVSNGAQITMPDVSGMSKTQAEQALRAAGWTGQDSVQSTPTNDLGLDGKVVSTSPAAGSKIDKSQTIILNIGQFNVNPPTSSTTSGIFPLN
jgi:eukaryotic-like serine/threonine-protein kinase